MHTNRAAVEEPAHESPALLHHFATKSQQKNAASLGMWLFLAQEVMFFGGLFCAYLVYRYKYFGDFGSASQQLDIRLGTINTVVLICSSLTVVLGIRAVQLGRCRELVFWLLATILLGLAFLGIKADEYAEKFERHHVPGASFSYHELLPGQAKFPAAERQYANPHHAEMFFSLYFAMTGMHALHMVVGVGLFGFLAYMAWHGKYTTDYYTPIENAGLYWHFVDVVWIYLFGLLYLIDRHR
ncbi:MAG TPA: cytochrome c oxidase subunit 3 family protein [Terriglobales bacterium]|nr:cytochrome c oxidase subunit 3 family protein [Terriglobales bacterium]